MIILETERLCLRTWKNSDLDPMSAIDKDPLVCQYLPGIGTRKETEDRIARFMAHFHQHGFTAYAVELQNTGEMIGFTGLLIPSFEAHFTPAVEIGWRLSSRHWNCGLATEAASAVLQYAFTALRLESLVSFTTVPNRTSRRVMEKIGMHHNPDDDFDHPTLPAESPLRRHVLYRLDKSAWIQSFR